MKNFKKVFLLAIICLLIFACSKKNEDNESVYEEMDLQTQKAIVDDMIGLYEELLLNNTAEKSRELLVTELKIIADITDAGISEDGITVWWEYKDGLEFYFLTESALSNLYSKSISNVKKEKKSLINDTIIPENKNALILSPYQYEWDFFSKPNATEDIALMLNDINYNVNYKLNTRTINSLTLDDYKHFEDYSVIAIATHGGVDDSNGNVFINTGVPLTEELKKSLKSHIQEGRVGFSKNYTTGSVALFNTYVICLKSSWFEYVYDNKLNQALFYMGACKSYYNESLANALVGNESAFLGWTENVDYGIDRDAGIDLFNSLFEGQTIQGAHKEVFENGNTFDNNTGSSFMISSNSYNNLALIENKEEDLIGLWYFKTILTGTITYYKFDGSVSSTKDWWDNLFLPAFRNLEINDESGKLAVVNEGVYDEISITLTNNNVSFSLSETRVLSDGRGLFTKYTFDGIWNESKQSFVGTAVKEQKYYSSIDNRLTNEISITGTCEMKKFN